MNINTINCSPEALQLDSSNNLQHLLTIEGLKPNHLLQILDTADTFMDVQRQPIAKPLLKNTSIFNLFFENSTRTRTTFEIAEKNLSAKITNLNLSTSATRKGETLLDTVRNFESMGADMFVIRHGASGAAGFFAQHVQPHVAVINAGDGRYAHPTQALLDIATIRHHKPNFSQLRVAIVGDILHSRVARSQIHALNLLEVSDIRVIGPKTLIPKTVEQLGVRVFNDLDEGLKDADVVIGLRIQRERMDSAFFPSEREFFARYGLTKKRLETVDPDAIIMHPGPVNRGVEMASDLMDGNRSVILQQVTEGIAIRMAVLSLIAQTRQGNA